MPSVADAKDALMGAMRRPGGIGGLGDVIEQASRVAAQAAGDEAIAAEGTALEDFIFAVIEIIVDMGLWALLLAIAGIVISMKETEFMLTKICDAIPFNLGSGPKAFITGVFSPIDKLEGWVADRMGDLIVNIAVNWVHGFKTFMLYQFGLGAETTGGVSSAQVKTMQKEINDLTQRVTNDEKTIAYLQSHVGTVAVAVPGTSTIEQRVTKLELSQAPLIHDVNKLHSDVTLLSHDVNVMQRTLTGLTTNLNAVRAEQFGVQDSLLMLRNGLDYAEYEIGQILPQVESHARTLHVLSPLQSLLYLGTPGLKVLQKLEQQPCQCPQLPGLPGDQSGLLAAYEFLTNG